MPFIIDVSKIVYQPGAYANAFGVQCVALVTGAPVKKGSKRAPGTSQWRNGIKVKTASPSDIAEGTVIATFTSAGTYPTRSEGNRHAAVYVSHSENGIVVIDQWVSKPTASKRTLRYAGDDSARSVDKGDHYYVVEVAEATPAE